MILLNCFRRLWHVGQLQSAAVKPAEKADSTTRMLQDLQHLCATLPQGEAEVWLQSGQVNITLHWNPAEKLQGTTLGKTQGKLPEKPQGPAGLYFLLNGQKEEVQVAEWNEEDVLPAEAAQIEAAQTKDSPQNIDQLNKNTFIPVSSEMNRAVLTPEREDAVHMNEGVTAAAKATSAAEADEKPSRQQKSLKRMLDYLQLLLLDAGNTLIKEIFKSSQLKENEPICIVMNKKGGASHITTHPLGYALLYNRLFVTMLVG